VIHLNEAALLQDLARELAEQPGHIGQVIRATAWFRVRSANFT
jgi:hypothetical protein